MPLCTLFMRLRSVCCGLWPAVGISAFLLVFCLASPVLAAPGDLDASFNPGTGAEKMPVIWGLYKESDSSFLVYGSFSMLGVVEYDNIARIGTTGAADPGFTPPDIFGEVRSVGMLSSGKYAVGGDFRIIGDNYYDLVLLNADGSLDTNFWSAFNGQGCINDLVVQSDDDIVCGGQGLELADVGTDPTRHLLRVQSNGFADGSYPVFNGPRAYVAGLDVETEDQQILDQVTVFGAFNEGTTTQINWLGFLDTGGSVVASQEDGVANDGPILARLTTSGGKVFVVGNFSVAFGNQANRVMRLNANGTLDTSFAMSGGPNGDVTGAVLLSDDSLVIVGAFTKVNGVTCNRIARLLTNGQVDNSFSYNGGANAPILSIGYLTSSALYVTGAFTTFNGQTRKGLAAITTSGGLLTTFASFNPSLGVSEVGIVHDLVKDASGNFVVGGDFNWFGGAYAPNLVRLESDGGVDASFSAGLGPDGVVYDVDLASDGSIYAGGDFGGAATRPLGGVARFDDTGAVDAAFTPIVTRNDNSPAPVYAVLAESGGTVLVGGHVRKVDGQAREPLARLDQDGRLNAAFNPQVTIASGTNLQARTILAVNGGCYVGGYVTYEGLARGFFTRLTATGALDTTFAPTSPAANVVITAGLVHEASLQRDGSPVICGEFLEIIDGSFFSNPQRRGLARFSATGALDEFDSTTGAMSYTYVYSVASEPKGQVLFSGRFTTYNNVARARIARTSKDGSLDESFDPGAGVPDSAWVVRRVGPRMGLVGGAFLTYDGTSRKGLAAFELDLQPTPGTGPLLLLLK